MKPKPRTRLWAMSLALGGCAPHVVAPRVPPAGVVPAITLPDSPPAKGFGRVVFSTSRDPLLVQARAVRPNVEPETVPLSDLCVSPCAIDLPLGEYQFVLELPEGTGDQDEATFTVSPGVLHWVRDLGSTSPAGYRRATWYGVGAAVMFGVAATMLYTDFGLEPSEPDQISRQAERFVVGWIFVVGGLGVIAEGTFQAVKNGRGHVQAGATTTWRDPPATPSQTSNP